MCSFDVQATAMLPIVLLTVGSRTDSSKLGGKFNSVSVSCRIVSQWR